jgi:hypothetical protein
MVYRVDVMARAERDLKGLYLEVKAPESNASRKWYEGLKRQILSLQRLPNRCAVAPRTSGCGTCYMGVSRMCTAWSIASSRGKKL